MVDDPARAGRELDPDSGAEDELESETRRGGKPWMNEKCAVGYVNGSEGSAVAVYATVNREGISKNLKADRYRA